MKSLFHEYYLPDLEALWAHGLVALDSSVLLDFYSLSPDAAKDLLDTLKAIKDRLWLPHHVGLEYHRRRLPTIRKELAPYAQLRKDLERIAQQLQSKHEHPFVKDKTLKSFVRVRTLIDRELDDGEAEQKKRIRADSVLDEITSLFDNRVGLPYSNEQLAQINEEGKVRYENNVPPGYKDQDKTNGNEYGDLIIWKQLLDKAKEHKQGIIFVTNEKKDDWWLKDSDDILGPRRELRQQMKAVADSLFYMYRVDTFLKDKGTYLKQTVNDATIQEVSDFLGIKDEAKGYVMHAQPARFQVTENDADLLVERHAHAIALFGELLQWAGGVRDWCRNRKETPNMETVAPDIELLGKRGFHLYLKWSDDLPEKLALRLQAISEQCELAAQLQRPFQLRKADALEPAAKDFIEDVAAFLGLPPSS